MKQNDWIVASINNPTYDAQDFQYIAGMTLDNTQLLPKSEYTKSQFIRGNEAFKDEYGNFSEKLFDDFYNQAAQNFSDFSAESEIDDYQYSMWDVLRPEEGKVQSPDFNIQKRSNPQHISIGVAGINEVANSNKSMRELAQSSKIYDPATGEYLDKSVNDLSLWNDPIGYFKSIFGEPLVYATYDEDTEEIDPVTGNKVLHKKGEWKVNDEGEYYVEKLNGRSLIGKTVVSALDYLTPEDLGVNKYDPFDSDDLEKSVGGNIAKNVAAVIPMFIPYVNVAYAGLLVGREISKSLPMLYGMIQGLQGSDEVNSKLLNTIAAYGQTFTGSSSDYAQQNVFSFENFANLMSDVALQWGQQKFIAQTFSKLTSGGNRAIESAYAKAQKEYVDRAARAIDDAYAGKLSGDLAIKYIGTNSAGSIDDLIKSGKWVDTAFGKAAVNKYVPAAQKIAESRMRIGQDLSLVYMAMVSNTDVYESVLEHGGTPQEAAAIALGSMIGMFSVDKYLGLGEMFFNDEPARRAIRNAARKNAEDLMKTAGIKQAETQTKKGVIGLIQRGIDSGRKAVQDYRGAIKDRTLGFIGKSLGEGLEEVSEELVADISKGLGELAGKLGYFSQSDYGAWENAFDRYAMSFLGGAAGGGLFYGVDAVQNRNKKTQEFQTDLIYLLRQGKKDEIIAEITRMKKNGQLGSKNLSYQTIEDSSGNRVFLTAENEASSQSQYIYDTLVKTINQLDFILNDNQLKLSDDEVFDRMVQGEYRAIALSDFLKGDKEEVKNISYVTRYQEDFQNLAEQITNKESEIQNHINSTPDPSKRNTDFQEKLDKLKAEKQELVDRKNYLFGEGSLGYVEKMLFAMDTELSKRFLSLTYRQFIKDRFNDKSIEQLTESELQQAQKEWEQYKSKKTDLDQAFKLYKEIEKKINPAIQQVGDNIQEWEKRSSQFIQAYNKGSGSKIITYEDKLENESEEDYNDRNTKRDGETDDLYKARVRDRQQKIEKINHQRIADWINTMLDNPIDRNQFRLIQSNINILKKNLVQRVVRTFQLTGNPELTHKIWSLIEQSDLSDIQQLKDNIRTLVKENVQNEVDLEYAGRSMYDDYTWGGIKGQLEAIGEPISEYLTYGDLYKVLENYRQSQEASNLPYDPEQYLKILSNDMLGFDPNSSEKQDQINADVLQWYSLAILNDEIREQKWDTPAEITEEYLVSEVNNRLDDLFLGQRPSLQDERDSENGLDNRLKDIIDNLLDDPLIESLSQLENKTFSVNPVAGIMDTISKLSSNRNININEFLEQIYTQYQNGENAQSFQLTDEQEKVLSQFIEDLKMAEAFIHAASTTANYTNPVGHNKAINQFIANHKDVFITDQVLPEISEEYANFLINELGTFAREASNWIELSRINTGNKIRKFNTAEEKYVQSVVEFYKTNRDAFKINTTTDLLDGYESLSEATSLLDLAKVEQLLHNNYKKAVANGITLQEILDALVPKITNVNELAQQLTANLDENLDYSKLTSYNKLNLVISNFALSPKKFYSELDRFINSNGNLAPITIQEITAKTVLAQQESPELINSVLNYLSEKLKISIPILENTSVAIGLGGAGKTAVIAKMCSSDGDGVWLCGPKQSQVDTLINTLPKGQGKIKQQLMESVMGAEEYERFRKSFTLDADGVWKTSGEFGSVITGLDGNKTFKIKDSVTVNKISGAPKLIVIDEATHFNTAELQIISKFAKLNGCQVLLLGDDHQNGSVMKGVMMNLDREVCLAWRTPKLSISLRDNNTQKGSNLQSTINLIDQLDQAFIIGNEEQVAQQILTQVIPNFSYNYYNKEEFRGELITKELPQDIISKLSGSIGFIGASTSPAYKKLIDEKGEGSVTLIDPVSVQGQEFDYVIVDKDWNLPNDSASQLYFFLKDLYTMISRSRSGTVLIEREDLSRFHSIENELTGTSSLSSAISKFREQRLPIIHSIAEDLQEAQIQEEGVEQAEGKQSDKIEGTNSTQKDLEPEQEPLKDNSAENQTETDEAESQDNSTVETIDTPIRCYSNVSYSGIALRDVWTNNDDIRKDLGIFVRKGDIVKNGNDKKDIVRKLMQLKCIFNYGISNWGALPKEIRERFSQQSIDNAEYYISVEDPSENNQLIGLTDLDSDKRAINGKVVTLIARIPDRNGQFWELTLGGLANPQTWKDNEEGIRKSIEKRIEDGDSRSDELQVYLDNLHKNIIAYENRIAEITKVNQQFRINRPQFSGLTTLVKSSKELRLQSIDSDSDARPFDAACQYAIKSDVYVLTDDIPGISQSLKGKPVMYVSSNLLLDPSQLQTLYEQQKNDASLVPQVRMIVLDNMGVSFDSLYRKKYQDIYTVTQGDVKYYFPFESEPMGLRMYKSIWNFRANLKQFLRAYKDFKDSSELSQDDIIKLCKLDNQTYNKIRGDQKYLSEQDYRSQVDEKTKELLKPIWNFNDGLKDYREFRLGYSTSNGVYIRKLTNLTEDGPYQGKDLNDVLGIYINPDLAQQYEQVLDNLFNNILEKIVSSEGRDPLTYITKSLEKGWFRQVMNDRKISINMIDYSEDLKGTIKTGVLNFDNDKALSAIPSVIVETAKFLNFKTLNQVEFEEYLQQNPDRYNISFGDEKLDWWGIDQVFEKDRPIMNHDITYDYSQFTPGINPYELDSETGKPVGVIDDRLSNLFNLMFHGLTSTKRYNDLTGGEIRATDADFKYGFFTDPVLAPKQGANNVSALTVTNHRLFGAKVYPGLPIIGISLDPYSEQLSLPQPSQPQVSQTQPQAGQTQVPIQESILDRLADKSTHNMNVLTYFKIAFTEEQLEDVQSIEDLKELVDQKIISRFKKFWSTQGNNLDEIVNLPVSTYITQDNKLGILSLGAELRSQDDGVSQIQQAYWDQNHLIVKMNSGKSFTIDQSPSGALITPVANTEEPGVINSTIDDLATQIREIVDQYSQPNNEDGLDPDSAKRLMGFVDRVIKKGKRSEDVNVETKNRIINQIQEALQNTDLEDEINSALTQLKNICKLN